MINNSKIHLSVAGTIFLTSYFLTPFSTAGIEAAQNEKKQGGEQYTFNRDIAPLLKTNCMPCHFAGGKVYVKLPFDDYATVKSKAKRLNTRLQEDEQKKIVDGWIASGLKLE